MTRRVLIVSPHFPPVNAPDMQRIRLSLPYLREFGWEAHVLAVAPDPTAQAIEPRLTETLPLDAAVTRVDALPARATAWCGLRNIGWRAWPALYRAGTRLLREQKFDVVYFSTTQFICMPMGRLWLRRFGVPYVIDLQDPWLNDYYFQNAAAERPGGVKYLFSHASAWILERWTLARCAGLVCVSENYGATVKRRYPRLKTLPTAVIPFGIDDRDVEMLKNAPAKQDLFSKDDGKVHAVSIGRGGDDLLKAVDALFSSVADCIRHEPSAASRLRLHFAGTNYAPASHAEPMFNGIAARRCVSGQFHERPWRMGYFEALQCQLDADAIIILGSDDGTYSPSKLPSVLRLGRPVIAVVLAGSLLEKALPASPRLHKLVFDSAGGVVSGMADLVAFWRALVRGELDPRSDPPILEIDELHSLHAKTLTGRQADFLASVCSR